MCKISQAEEIGKPELSCGRTLQKASKCSVGQRQKKRQQKRIALEAFRSILKNYLPGSQGRLDGILTGYEGRPTWNKDGRRKYKEKKY